MLENEHPASVRHGVWPRRESRAQGRRGGGREGGAVTERERAIALGARVAPASDFAVGKGEKEK
jgi:hypothetical protein